MSTQLSTKSIACPPLSTVFRRVRPLVNEIGHTIGYHSMLSHEVVLQLASESEFSLAKSALLQQVKLFHVDFQTPHASE